MDKQLPVAGQRLNKTTSSELVSSITYRQISLQLNKLNAEVADYDIIRGSFLYKQA